jgi:magnesium chelatase subunit I
MNIQKIKTLGELKASGYQPKSIKEELRRNLICKLQKKENTFPGIIGYEDSVIPDVERALLSRHNILFLGLRGQAKTRMARQMIDLLDNISVISGSDIDTTYQAISKYALDQIAARRPRNTYPLDTSYGKIWKKLATQMSAWPILSRDIDQLRPRT